MNNCLIALHYSNIFSYKELKCLEEKYGDYEQAWIKLEYQQPLFRDPLEEKNIKEFIRKNKPEDLISKLRYQNINPITIYDTNYPSLLKESKNPPLVLYTRGELSLFQENMLAIVGTRSPTPYGRKVAYELSSDLSGQLTIVSGLALGIDSEAHKGAIKGIKKTIAILGSGLNHPYPPQNINLFKEIVLHGGLLLSEYPPFIKPEAWRFPLRNRIIASISLGTVVIEAGNRSGALITARIALDEGREVMAVPGLVTNPKATGSNALIKDGAHLISSSVDIMELFSFLPMFLKQKNAKEKDENELTSLLSGGPLSVEELSTLSKKSLEYILYDLTLLELKGDIKREGGLYYRLKGLE